MRQIFNRFTALSEARAMEVLSGRFCCQKLKETDLIFIIVFYGRMTLSTVIFFDDNVFYLMVKPILTESIFTHVWSGGNVIHLSMYSRLFPHWNLDKGAQSDRSV